MVQAIPTVHNKLFGISYLQGQQKKQLEEQWQLRMCESDALLIEAEPNHNYQAVVTALCERIEEQGIEMNPQDPCILVFFVDLQKEINPELLRQIEAGIQGVLNPSIQAVLQFGYVGKLGLQNPAVQRENACKQVEANRDFFAVPHRLCLVATPFVAGNGSSEWKSVCVYLDVLSRQNAPANLMPGTGSGYMGYLRYGEFNEETYNALVARDEELTTLLGNGGTDRFEKLLENKANDLRRMVRARFPITGSCQPLHPDMFLAPGNVFTRKQNQAKIAAAQEASETALVMTGQRLKNDITRAFDAVVAGAETTLKEMADAVPLGLSIRANAAEMANILSIPADSQKEPPKPTLSKDCCGQVTEAYLKQIRDDACSVQIQRFYEALRKASATLYDAGAAAKKTELEAEQKKTKARLKKIYPPQAFCEKFAYGSNLPEGQFSPVNPIGPSSQTFLLCTNALAQTVGNYTSPATSTLGYCIANSAPDEAPLKGVQIVFLDCTSGGNQNVIKQLLPEVNV